MDLGAKAGTSGGEKKTPKDSEDREAEQKKPEELTTMVDSVVAQVGVEEKDKDGAPSSQT